MNAVIAPVEISDDRGATARLWSFPHAANGVPAGIAISVRDQTALEQNLGVPWHRCTPNPLSLRSRLGLTAMAMAFPLLTWLLGGPPGAPALAFWAGLASFAWLPAAWQRRSALPSVGVLVVYLLAMAGLLEQQAREMRPFRNVLSGVVIPAAFFALPVAALAIGDIRKAWRFRRTDPRRTPAAVRRVMLAAQRCPSCACSLAPCPVQRDGCCVCGGCGGAWRVPGRTPDRNPQACPGCGYTLGGLPINAAYAVRCPECGAEVAMPESMPDPQPPRTSAGPSPTPPSG